MTLSPNPAAPGRFKALSGLCLLGALGALSSVSAQDSVETLAPVTIIGGPEEVWDLAGAASYVTTEDIRRQGYTNVNQVLAKVPGVYVREEDGFGNFPNISLRGADGTRSEKVTIMEDGILTMPGPYSAPAAYYFPRVARMSGIEVLKGSSQVLYGPQTTGGVINFLSTPFPELPGSYISDTPSGKAPVGKAPIDKVPVGPNSVHKLYSRSQYGSYNTWHNHSYAAGAAQTEAGRLGYVLELHSGGSDGFRDIPERPRDTGYNFIEPMLKLYWEPNTELKQRIEFKVGYTNFDADESYTGLTESDVARNPDRRYAASYFDNIETEQWRTYLKYIVEPTSHFRVESAVYYNKFTRNWYKLDKIGTAGGSPRSIHQVLADRAYAAELDVLRGRGAGFAEVKANNRSYEAYGWQNNAYIDFTTGAIEHEINAGFRLHYDSQRRDHWLDRYTSTGNPYFKRSESGITAGQDNRLEEVSALAVHFEDTMRIGSLSITPGVRYEWLDLDYTNYNNHSANASGSKELWMAGIGANYELSESNAIFGGVYRGVSAPGAQAVLLNGVEEEESVGYELGVRHRKEAFNAELVGFFTDFSNLVSTDTGFGAQTISQNSGAAEVYGLEAAVAYDVGHAAGWAFGLPTYVSATWTSAKFVGTSPDLVGGGDNVYDGGRDGNKLPYIPDWRLAAGVGIEYDKFSINLDMIYNSDSWGTGYNGDKRPGTQSSRDGRIDSLLTFDLTAKYRVTENVSVFGGIQNLFDERTIVSRIPEGPRANAPRMLFIGVEAEF